MQVLHLYGILRGGGRLYEEKSQFCLFGCDACGAAYRVRRRGKGSVGCPGYGPGHRIFRGIGCGPGRRVVGSIGCGK